MAESMIPGRDRAQDIFGDRFLLAQRYEELLKNEGTIWGLIGPREAERLWERHILNSLCVAEFIPVGSRVADLGTGAGLPGIPLAIYRQDLHLTLVEPMERRVKFLEVCIEELSQVEHHGETSEGESLDQRVKVVRSRLEEFHARGSVDVFTCRALASVAKLVTMMGPLLEEAPLLAIKGGRAEEEIVAARDTLREHGLEARTFHVEHFGTVVEIHRESISQIVR